MHSGYLFAPSFVTGFFFSRSISPVRLLCSKQVPSRVSVPPALPFTSCVDRLILSSGGSDSSCLPGCLLPPNHSGTGGAARVGWSVAFEDNTHIASSLLTGSTQFSACTGEPPTSTGLGPHACGSQSTSAQRNSICGPGACARALLAPPGPPSWPSGALALPEPLPCSAARRHRASSPACKHHGGACALHDGCTASAHRGGGAPPPCTASASAAAHCGTASRRTAGRTGRQDGCGQC